MKELKWLFTWIVTIVAWLCAMVFFGFLARLGWEAAKFGWGLVA